MSAPDAAQLLREYIRMGKLMQVATVQESQPWVANVWYAFDDRLNLYFISQKTRRHSEEIHQNERVAGSIMAVPLEGLGQKGRGVTFEGAAKELTGVEQRAGFEQYAARWSNVSDYTTLTAIENGESATRIYCITPKLYVLFDEVNFPDISRQEVRSW